MFIKSDKYSQAHLHHVIGFFDSSPGTDPYSISILGNKPALSPTALQAALAGTGKHVRIDEAAMNGTGNKANPIYVVVEEGESCQPTTHCVFMNPFFFF